MSSGFQETPFSGREWLFDRITAWSSDRNGPRYFVLSGAPGAGKSAVARRLQTWSESGEAPARWSAFTRKWLGAFHFCLVNDLRTRNPRTFAESLSRQLAQSVSGFTETLVSSASAGQTRF